MGFGKERNGSDSLVEEKREKQTEKFSELWMLNLKREREKEEFWILPFVPSCMLIPFLPFFSWLISPRLQMGKLISYVSVTKANNFFIVARHRIS